MASIFRLYSIKLVVNKICIDYKKSIQAIQGTEPEMFCESWLRHNIENSNQEFDNEVTEEFIVRLAKDGIVH